MGVALLRIAVILVIAPFSWSYRCKDFSAGVAFACAIHPTERGFKPSTAGRHVMPAARDALRMKGGSEASASEQAMVLAAAGPVSMVAHRPTIVEANVPSSEWSKERLFSFAARDYRAPWVFRNPHVNTIVGALFATPPPAPYRRERFDTPDGDFFTVDFLDSRDQRRPPRGLVFLYHGLEANTNAPLTVREAWSLAEAGFDVAAISFRGCSGEDNLRPGAYHLGFTDDVKFLAQTLHKRDPTRRMYVTGTSLGGNVMTKLLGELGEDAVKYGILGGAVACVPTSDNSAIDNDPFNRKVYSGNFLKSLKPKAERQAAKFPDAFDIEKIRNATTIGEFDDFYISKIYGFKDKYDYYDKNICKSFLKKVRVPLYMINARDDPFFNPAEVPTYKDVQDATVRLFTTDEGGHCGYIDSWKSLSIGSLEAVISKLVFGKRIQTTGNAPNGWLPDEMTRFLVHLDDGYSSREFGRLEQIQFTKQAEVEVQERLVTLERQVRDLKGEVDDLQRQKDALMEDKLRTQLRREARDDLMRRLEAIYSEAEEKSRAEIERTFATRGTLAPAPEQQGRIEWKDDAQKLNEAQGEVTNYPPGRTAPMLQRIMAEALLAGSTDMYMKAVKEGLLDDEATLLHMADTTQTSSVTAAILARMDALRTCMDRIEQGNKGRGASTPHARDNEKDVDYAMTKSSNS